MYRGTIPRMSGTERMQSNHSTHSALESVTPRPPVLGFTTHALAKATQPLHGRCTRVVTKETLTQELPELLKSGVAA